MLRVVPSDFGVPGSLVFYNVIHIAHEYAKGSLRVSGRFPGRDLSGLAEVPPQRVLRAPQEDLPGPVA